MNNWFQYNDEAVTKIWPKVHLFNQMSYESAYIFVFSSTLSDVQNTHLSFFPPTSVNQPFLHHGYFNQPHNKHFIWNLPHQSTLFSQQLIQEYHLLNPLKKMDVSTLTMSAFSEKSLSSTTTTPYPCFC